jgi:hypothetical protein
MATPTSIDPRIDIGLESLRLMLGDLPEVAEEWNQLDDGEQVHWSLDWDQLMGSDLPLLEAHFRADRMTAAQRERYRAVLTELKAALPLIERLDLYRPTVPLES